MKIVFMGTPDFAVPSLVALLDSGHEVTAVVTQPDRPSGRGQAVHFSPVKQIALDRGIPVEQPAKLRDPSVLESLRSRGPQVIVVAAYGKILPKSLLELPPLGAINVHGSLLPKYRGAAPIQRALLAGDPVTGITIMQMNERMDAGDLLLQRELEIRPDDTSETLQARMAGIGAAALTEALAGVARGEIHPQAQDDEAATLAPMIRKEEGEIDWSRHAIAIERAVRAFQPWPGAFTWHDGGRLKLLRASPLGVAFTTRPGTVLQVTAEGIDVSTGQGALRILEAQPEGKRRMLARDLSSGRIVRPGTILGHGAESAPD